ncbi:MAG: hypothetical protein ACKOXT_01345 [Actinomycetota bacterium]
MPVSFLDSQSGSALRSTEFARQVLAAAARDYPKLADEILGAPDWRQWYLRLYARLAIEEGRGQKENLQIASLGLAEFHRHLFVSASHSLDEHMAKGWEDSDSKVLTVSIKGSAQRRSFAIPGHNGPLANYAHDICKSNFAEPGLVKAFEFLDKNPNLDISKDLLFAVAGAAEFAPTLDWLAWGGKVAVVARDNPETWKALIESARKTGGELIIPVLASRLSHDPNTLTDEQLCQIAGLDITRDHAEIANWMASFAKASNERIVLGLYGYAPGIDHIRVQAVQETLADVAMNKLTPESLALSWLATPTDSAPAPASIGNASLEIFKSRKSPRIIRDSLLGVFGAAKAANPKFFEGTNGEKLVLIDASVQQQGPSYSFSKRTQRWRAYLANSQGYRVSYAIAPPARTDSVLRHKILRASYRGAPLFGVKPFDVASAKAAVALVLVRDLHDPKKEFCADTTSLHTDSAIHGGLWRMAYKPKSVWIAATILGIADYFRRAY